uniref:Uncharacterized protein n=1 Tax=Ciona intestinalis TaxID=7719 RepID=H2Y1F6_CIOIN
MYGEATPCMVKPSMYSLQVTCHVARF